MSIPVPRTSEYIIAFERGLFTYANQLTKVVVGTFPYTTSSEGISLNTSPEAIYDRISSRPVLLSRFFDILVSYVRYGGPTRSLQYWIEPEYRLFASSLRDSMEMFALAHEYSHILLGHLTRNDAKRRSLTGTDAEVLDHSSREELDADVRGFNIVVSTFNATRGWDLYQCYGGAALYFASMELVEKSVSILQLASGDLLRDRTHPPAETRRIVIREALRIQSEIQWPEHFQRAIDFEIAISWALDVMWEYTKPRLLALHEQGVRPAEQWSYVLSRP